MKRKSKMVKVAMSVHELGQGTQHEARLSADGKLELHDLFNDHWLNIVPSPGPYRSIDNGTVLSVSKSTVTVERWTNGQVTYRRVFNGRRPPKGKWIHVKIFNFPVRILRHFPEDKDKPAYDAIVESRLNVTIEIGPEPDRLGKLFEAMRPMPFVMPANATKG